MILKQKGKPRVALYKEQANRRPIFVEAPKDANNIQTVKKNKDCETCQPA